MESVYHIYKLIEFHLYYTKVNRIQFTPRTGRMLTTSVMEYRPPSVPIKYGAKYLVIFKRIGTALSIKFRSRRCWFQTARENAVPALKRSFAMSASCYRPAGGSQASAPRP